MYTSVFSPYTDILKGADDIEELLHAYKKFFLKQRIN